MLFCITFLVTSVTTKAASTSIGRFNNYVGFDIGCNSDMDNLYIQFSPQSSGSSSYTGQIRPNDYSGISDFTCGGNFHFNDSDRVLRTSQYYKLYCNFGVVSKFSNPPPTGSTQSSMTMVNAFVTIDGVDFPCRVITDFDNGTGTLDYNYTCVCYINRDQLYQSYSASDNFSNLPFTLHGQIRFTSVDTYSSTNVAFNMSQIAKVRLWYRIQSESISETDYVNGRSQIVRDVNGNAIAQQGNTIAQQGNDLQSQGNTIAQQGNDLQEEGNDIAQDTNDKVTSFFSSFFDNLIGVFVPESGFFSQWFSDLNTFMSQKLGFLWAPFDFIISFLNGVYSGSGSASITFPEFAWIDGTVIIPETQFSFDNIGGQSFTDLRDMIYFATDVILLGAVVMQFYQKLKLVFEGGSQ